MAQSTLRIPIAEGPQTIGLPALQTRAALVGFDDGPMDADGGLEDRPVKICSCNRVTCLA